jgi:hypothetical protein
MLSSLFFLHLSLTDGFAFAQLNFAAVTGVLMHTILYNGKEIVRRFKNQGGDDIHRRLMKQNYREVPWWFVPFLPGAATVTEVDADPLSVSRRWYAILQIVVAMVGVVAVRVWDTSLPVYGFLVVCMGFGLVFLIPEGILEGYVSFFLQKNDAN